VREVVRPWEAVAASVLLALSLLPLAARSQLDAQARTAIVLSTTLETPGLSWAVERLTDEPALAEVAVSGAPATLARPRGEGPWPALVIVNGATPLGRREPAVRRLVRGLGQAGFLVLAPDLPGLADGEVSERTVATAVAVARDTAGRPDAREGRVGLVGVSVGTSIALLAAADPSLAGSVSVVAGTAPYADLANLLRLATTGYYREGNLLIPYETSPFLAVAAARSLVAAMAPSPERTRLLALADRLDEEEDDPLAPLRGLPAPAHPDAAAFLALLQNRDPRRFDELYATLPKDGRAHIARLSPLTHARSLLAPVELASAPDDPYVPPAEPRALARAAVDGRLTLTSTLAHAVPAPSLGDLDDLLLFNAWVVRTLEAASG
jgi:pimeloyl-ACP methyl ester carboxylesterase